MRLPGPLLVARSLLLCMAAGCSTLGLHAQVQPQPASPAAAPARSASAAASAPAPRAAVRPSRPASGSAWARLRPDQQRALAPLAGSWDGISEAQRRKWLTLAENFARVPAPEQQKMHSRMVEWVALSPQQRVDARLNFGETQQVSPDEKKARWEAYQALPPEEKRRLAATASPKPPTTAAAVKPVPQQKLAATRKGPARTAKGPATAASAPGPAPAPAAAVVNTPPAPAVIPPALPAPPPSLGP